MTDFQQYLSLIPDEDRRRELCDYLRSNFSVRQLRLFSDAELAEIAEMAAKSVRADAPIIKLWLSAARKDAGARPVPGPSEEREVPGEPGQFEGGSSSTAVGTLAASLHSDLDEIKELLRKVVPKKDYQSFSSVSDATGYKVLTKLGYEVVDGNKVHPVILTGGVMSVGPINVLREEAITYPFLTEFQNLLQQQGVTFGSGGFEVVDTHSRPEAIMPLNVGTESFRGKLDGVVVPYGNLLYNKSMRLGVELKREAIERWAKRRKVSREGGEGSAAGAGGAGATYAQASISGQGTLEILAAHVYSEHPVDLVLTNGKWYMVYRLRFHDGVKKLIVWRFGDSNEDRAKAYQLIGKYLKEEALVRMHCSPADIEGKPGLAAGAPILTFMKSCEPPDPMEDQADVLITGPEEDLEERLQSALQMVKYWRVGEALGAVLPQPPESPGIMSYFS